MKKIIFCISMVMGLSMPIAAEENSLPSYFGGGYHAGTYEEDNFPDLDLGAINLKFGKYIDSNFAIEGRIVFGISDDSTDVYLDGYYIGVGELSIKNAISFFIKGDININENVNLYGLLGFTRGKLEAKLDGYTNNDTDSGLSYGFGIEAFNNEGLGVHAEYVSYIDEDDYAYTAFNIGIQKKI